MTTIDVRLTSRSKVRRSFDLLDRVEVETDEQRIVFHIGPSSVHAAAEAGASLLASARRQDQERDQ